ncbi:MAG: hypothetical protein HN891_07785 [Planctomycetes bacterium]|jgi:hypothetical protein|nr:hypothetical protein [Planctomycetota bacterium]MBT6453708.1 hypothetical protein [Planctomycetota bacterium]MBT6540099.1 hypothetical protein [Planctomycetota bacterium]MBT6783654.1 hypothetical protein [Planctomycetota bacterium]MBT6967350.1 hypothetical protein [Planctomycetota bacterium]
MSRARGLSFLLIIQVSLLIPGVCCAASSFSSSSQESHSVAPTDEFDSIQVGDRVRVKLRRGGSYEGEVVEKAGDSISIKHRFGTAKVDRANLLEWERFKTIPEQYEERAQLAKSAEDWCDLGDWALEQQEQSLARESWRKATEISPGLKRARDALGEIEYEGRWMPLEEAMGAQGKELYGGEWLTPDEIVARQEEESTAKRAQSLKGRDAYIEELRGRDWATIEPIITPHYVIYCNSTEENARYYSDVMESLYRAYDKVFIERFWPRKFKRAPRSDVYIHANHQQFMDWTGNGPNIGGFYNLLRQDVTGYHGSFGSTGSTEEVLAHEGTHQFQGMIFKSLQSLPIWTVEGLAVYFGDGSKISRRKVEINEIPRDRLVGLKAAIEDGNFCTLSTLLRLNQGRFGGFYYGHAWGVFFWCLYGNEYGAWSKSDNTGGKIMEDWLLHCQQLDGFCDYEKEAKFFEQLIVQHSGQSVEEWEEEYKEWILGLPVEELGRKRGNKFSSEELKLEVTKPIGWRWQKSGLLYASEVCAAIGGGSSKKKRLSTYSWPNGLHAELSEDYARSLIGNIFGEVKYVEEIASKQMGGNPMYVAVLDGKRVIGTAGNNVPELGEPRRFAIGIFGSPDKLYGNVLECSIEDYPDALQYFEKFTENFLYTG